MKKPSLYIALSPLEAGKIKNFFKSDEGSAFSIMQNPTRLRYSGWDLVTHSKAEIVEGKFIEIHGPNSKAFRLYEDGTFLVGVSADKDFLAHASGEEGDPVINPLALTEFIYNVCVEYIKFVDLIEPVPSSFGIVCKLSNLIGSGRKLGLSPNPVDTMMWQFRHGVKKAVNDEIVSDFGIEASELKPEVLTYKIIAQIYRNFGITDDQIPYTKELGGATITDIDLIIK